MEARRDHRVFREGIGVQVIMLAEHSFPTNNQQRYFTTEGTEGTARPLAGTKKDKETTENKEHAEKQIDFFCECRAFRSRQKLIVVGRLSGSSKYRPP